MSQIAATLPNAVGAAPDGDHGDTAARPKAPPKLIKMKEIPTAPMAPAVIAPQWTAEAELSTSASGTRTAGFVAISFLSLLSLAGARLRASEQSTLEARSGIARASMFVISLTSSHAIQPRVHVLSNLIFSVAVALLNFAFELIAPTIYLR
jgi:hypothetical protein